MQVEARLVQRTQGLPSSGTGSGMNIQLEEDDDDPKSKPAKITAEFKSWARLFSGKFIDRTWIGILMMVFQRACGCSPLPYSCSPVRGSCGAVVPGYPA